MICEENCSAWLEIWSNRMRCCSWPVKLAHTKYNHKPRCWWDLSGSEFLVQPHWAAIWKHISWVTKIFIPTDAVILLLGNRRENNWEYGKKRGLQYNDHNPSIIFSNEKLEAIQGPVRLRGSEPFTASDYRKSRARYRVLKKLSSGGERLPPGLKLSNISPLLYSKPHTLVSLEKYCFNFLLLLCLCVRVGVRGWPTESAPTFHFMWAPGIKLRTWGKHPYTCWAISVAPKDVFKIYGLIRDEH